MHALGSRLPIFSIGYRSNSYETSKVQVDRKMTSNSFPSLGVAVSKSNMLRASAMA